MELILTKNNLCDLNVFFYKKGYANVHRPFLSMLKIDSVSRTTPIFHIGFDRNMGFSSGYKMYSGVMVFEVLDGYPLQSIMFTNNKTKKIKTMQQTLEDLEVMDFYCLQRKNKDPYGDFILKDVKFIETRMTQSTQDYSRRIVASFVCSSKIPFKFPYFFNEFVSDNYNNHIVRRKSEIEKIKIDIKASEKILNEHQHKLSEYISILNPNIDNYSIDQLCYALSDCYTSAVSEFNNRKPLTKKSPIFRIRDFIHDFYKFRNQCIMNDDSIPKGDLWFLKLLEN